MIGHIILTFVLFRKFKEVMLFDIEFWEIKV